MRGIKPPPAGPMANILRGPYIIPIEMRQAYVRVFAFPEFTDHPRFKQQYSPEVYAHLSESWKNPNAVPGASGHRNASGCQTETENLHCIRRPRTDRCRDGCRFAFQHAQRVNKGDATLCRRLTPMEVIQSAIAGQMQGVEKERSPKAYADMVIVDGASAGHYPAAA